MPNPEDIDLRLVRYMTTLAEELHFGRAAARLHIAQQTLSGQISKLEQRLGVVLFERDHRTVRVTQAGESFVARGRRLLDFAAALVSETYDTGLPIRFDVLTEGLTSGAVARSIRQRLPELPLEVLQGQGLPRALDRLRRGEIDLAYGRASGVPQATRRSFQHMLVSLEPIGVVLPEAHRLADEARISVRLAELKAFPLLLHTAVEAPEWEEWNLSLIARFALTVGRHVHGHGRGTANEAALAYDMPTLAPLSTSLPPGLVMFPLVDPVPLCPVWLMWGGAAPADGRRSTGVNAVIDVVDELAGEQGWRDYPGRPWWLPDADRADLARTHAARRADDG
ncbi:LysR family transcriptional regulator [Streptomyces sp. NBC_00063]|uniref:LysR family transcriptional regulator n=1 Tax=Streptomyces sp. NBC_00063 TaxID=2975638 RepID=UPI003D75058B